MENELFEALEELAEQVEDDCPAEYMSKHLKMALETARQLGKEMANKLFYVEHILTLSTAHMPRSHPDFAGIQNTIVGVNTIVVVEEGCDTPGWLKPIIRTALRDPKCVLIMFSPDARPMDAFETFSQENW